MKANQCFKGKQFIKFFKSFSYSYLRHPRNQNHKFLSQFANVNMHSQGTK